MKKNILTVGDVHGNDLWKDYTHGSTYDFNNWMNSVMHGAPPDYDFWKEHPFMKYDRIVFVGDYADSFNKTNVEIKKNLEDIIFFRKVLPDKVVTLLGNHDVQYMVPNTQCSGFRGEMAFDLQILFRENFDLFKMAHLEIMEDEKWLWTHAGVTKGWIKEAKEELLKPDRFHAINRPYADAELDEMIHHLWKMESRVLFQVDRDSGGSCMWASPLWVRPRMLNEHYVEGYNQVVGHTSVPSPTSWIYEHNWKKYQIWYVDCLNYRRKFLSDLTTENETKKVFVI